jgi:hypothetical protein
LNRLAVIAGAIGCAAAKPCPMPIAPAAPPACFEMYVGPIPAVVHVRTLAEVNAKLASRMTFEAHDLEAELAQPHGPAFFAGTTRGYEHEGDVPYVTLHAVFAVHDGFVVVANLAQWTSPMQPPPRHGAPPRPRPLPERSSLEILGGKIGHLRIASDPPIDHFIDLELAEYLEGIVERGAPLTAWLADDEHVHSGECGLWLPRLR